MKLSKLSFVMGLLLTAGAHAQVPANALDEFDPSAPDAMEVLEEMTAAYEADGSSAMDVLFPGFVLKSNCVERGCKVFIDVDKAKQQAELYIEGELVSSMKVSTARAGKITRNHNGIIAANQFRIFDAKTSTSYPLKPGQKGYVEDGKDLGNMPYAVFYHGPYAIHGTTAIANLGKPASAGCVRLHPDNAKKFNRAVRAHGRAQTWVTVN